MLWKFLNFVALSAVLFFGGPPALHAEVDGEELQKMMQSDAGAELAQLFIDDVWQKWNGGLFCIPEGDRQKFAFDAVDSYLESHPEELYRPRRYLIVQALRNGFACATEQN